MRSTASQSMASEDDLTSGSPRHLTAGQDTQANAVPCWDSCFYDGPRVSDDVLAERATQQQAEREPF